MRYQWKSVEVKRTDGWLWWGADSKPFWLNEKSSTKSCFFKHLMGPVVIPLVFLFWFLTATGLAVFPFNAMHQSFYKYIPNMPPLPCAFADIFLHQRWLIFDLCIALKRSAPQRTENNPTRFSFLSRFSTISILPYAVATAPNSKSPDEAAECSAHSCLAHIIQMISRQ